LPFTISKTYAPLTRATVGVDGLTGSVVLLHRPGKGREQDGG